MNDVCEFLQDVKMQHAVDQLDWTNRFARVLYLDNTMNTMYMQGKIMVEILSETNPLPIHAERRRLAHACFQESMTFSSSHFQTCMLTARAYAEKDLHAAFYSNMSSKWTTPVHLLQEQSKLRKPGVIVDIDEICAMLNKKHLPMFSHDAIIAVPTVPSVPIVPSIT